jgi:hypothetical protein
MRAKLKRREVKTMSGIGGTKAYLDELFEIYDEHDPIGRVCTLELVRRYDMSYEDAAEYWERRKLEKQERERRATEAGTTHGHVEGRIGIGR